MSTATQGNTDAVEYEHAEMKIRALQFTAKQMQWTMNEALFFHENILFVPCSL